MGHQLLDCDRTKMKAFIVSALLGLAAAAPSPAVSSHVISSGHGAVVSHGSHVAHGVVAHPVAHAVHAPVAHAVHHGVVAHPVAHAVHHPVAHAVHHGVVAHPVAHFANLKADIPDMMKVLDLEGEPLPLLWT